MSYKVSFCIPSYENKNAVICMVVALLSCRQKEIQVVVCDDASTDGTYEELIKIKDIRLKIVHNEKNIGAKLNWNKVLEEGDGDYLYLAMGRDLLVVSKMDRLIEMLHIFDDMNVSVAMDRKYKGGIQVLNKVEALGYMIGAHHPTGLILKRQAFHEIKDRKDYFQINTTYPENYIKKELIVNHIAGIGYSGLFTDKTIIDLGKVKSRVEVSEDLEDTYFSPQQRIREGIHILEMVRNSDAEITDEEYSLFYCSMLEQFSSWILMWKENCENIEWMTHYGFRKKLVSKRELLEYLESFENELIKLEPNNEKANNQFHQLTIKMIEKRFSEDYLYRTSLKLQLIQKLLSKLVKNNITEYFNKNYISSVAIYGFGEVGNVLFELLRKSCICVKYAIDRDYLCRYSELDVFSPLDDLPDADAMVISLVSEDKEIRRRYQRRYKKIISVSELILEL